MNKPTLYAYPGLCGVADNNPFGLKVYAFMRLCKLPFEHRHILDTKNAPRGQLPYLDDGERQIGDSDAIVAYLKQRYGVALDDGLSGEQRRIDYLLRRTLDDLYWPMSYSRWSDERYWPLFRQLVLAEHPEISEADMAAAHDYNQQRYYYQGIGRYPPEQVYARGVADLAAVNGMLGNNAFLFGTSPHAIDAAVYGFVANIYFYDIDTPLKQFVLQCPGLARHCESLHARVRAGT